MPAPKLSYRSEYQPYPVSIPKIDLYFQLDAQCTTVTQTLMVERTSFEPVDLVLRGEGLQLLSVSVDERPLAVHEYTLTEESLTLHQITKITTITIENTNQPIKNQDLLGLFVSKNSIFTQCEAEGFRKITYHPDRPDVLSVYTVTIEADGEQYPILLSNGNLVAEKRFGEKKKVTWHDPHPKPSYLFALVAGDFACRAETITTPKGHTCTLQIYSDHDAFDKTAFALTALKDSILWDEQRFGLSIDLERFMIVATRDFSMGAMENKGLNIFNSAYVLAHSDYSTDQNFLDVQAVIGHEYFHNWTGNRITCRDWFQLSLKEGLTVFRDQEFSADQFAKGLPETAAKSARAIKRIEDVTTLRMAQFPEDAGPMAHPIRPDSYQTIDNFYTATIYEKGAEVIRMLHTLMGEELFQRGMQIYIQRHDGQAVTCDDFLDAMQTAYQSRHPSKNFDIFRRWYAQAGTPTVQIQTSFYAETSTWVVTAKQTCPKVGIERQQTAAKLPFHIPLAIAAYDPSGASCSLNGEPHVLLELTEEEQSWSFTGLHTPPIISLLHHFSAPVYIDYNYTIEELFLLSDIDQDPFARWEALQSIYRKIILSPAQPHPLCDSKLQALLEKILTANDLDYGYIAQMLTLPSLKFLSELQNPVHPVVLAEQSLYLEQWIGQHLGSTFQQMYQQLATSEEYTLSAEAIGKRALKNLSLRFLLAGNSNATSTELAREQYVGANNFTDRWYALLALVKHRQRDAYQDLVDDFYQRYQKDPLVIDQWFSLQAIAPQSRAQDILRLAEHPDFHYETPNRVRALFFQFCHHHPHGFYAADGSGYALLLQTLIKLDAINPAIAARLLRVLDHWKKLEMSLQAPIKDVLLRLKNTPNLSKNLSEILSRLLENT